MAAGGLSTRELIIIARLQNQASAGLQQVQRDVRATGLAGNKASLRMFALSNAFEVVGRGLRNFGAATLATVGVAAKFAADFDQGMKLVRTQTDLTEREFENLRSSVLTMAEATGRSTDELAEGLFDIFSSVFVNAGQATKMLELFAQAAVAGGTDVRTVARGAIAVMNSFGLSADDTSRILDAQFGLVRLGIGTYEEFANAIGRLTPSAVAAGASLEVMSGLLAFSTRGGLNATEAVTALARAYDLISRPKVVKALHDVLGIEAVDKATGKYKQLDDIVTEMATTGGLAQMEAFERKKVLQSIFGQGEIRALRFFNIAIPRFEDMNRVVREAAGPGTTGAMNEAFKTMAESGRNLLDRLKQIGKVFLIEFGRPALEVLKDLVPKLKGIVDWFKNLDAGTKKFITRSAILLGAFSLITGAVMLLMSGVMRMISIFQLAGIRIAAIAGPIGLVVAIVGTLVVVFGDILGISKSLTVKLVGLALGFLWLKKALIGVGGALAESGWKNFGLRLSNIKSGLSGVSSGTSTLMGLLTPGGGLLIGIGLIAAGLAQWWADAQKVKETTRQLTEALKDSKNPAVEYAQAIEDLNAQFPDLQEGSRGIIDIFSVQDDLFRKSKETLDGIYGQAIENNQKRLKEQAKTLTLLNSALVENNAVLSKGEIAMIHSAINAGNFELAERLLAEGLKAVTAAVKNQGRGLDALSRNGNDAAAATEAVDRATRSLQQKLKNVDAPLLNNVARYREIWLNSRRAAGGIKSVADVQANIKQAARNADVPMMNLAARYKELARQAGNAARNMANAKQQLEGSPYGWYFHVTAQRVKEYTSALRSATTAAGAFVAPGGETVSSMGGGGGAEVHFHLTDPAEPNAKKIVTEIDWYRRTSPW